MINCCFLFLFSFLFMSIFNVGNHYLDECIAQKDSNQRGNISKLNDGSLKLVD